MAMKHVHEFVTTGIGPLDQRLGGLFIGDNVIWYDAAGSLAPPFALNFLKASQAERKALIYVSFDRSPKILLQDLGALAESRFLTVLDCFTEGKGEGSALFNQFYEHDENQRACRVIKVTEPEMPGKSEQWCIKACTRVPLVCPGAGCTTIPGALLTTSNSVSS